MVSAGGEGRKGDRQHLSAPYTTWRVWGIKWNRSCRCRLFHRCPQPCRSTNPRPFTHVGAIAARRVATIWRLAWEPNTFRRRRGSSASGSADTQHQMETEPLRESAVSARLPPSGCSSFTALPFLIRFRSQLDLGSCAHAPPSVGPWGIEREARLALNVLVGLPRLGKGGKRAVLVGLPFRSFPIVC